MRATFDPTVRVPDPGSVVKTRARNPLNTHEPLFNYERANRVQQFIEKYLHVPEGMLYGQPIKLLPEQKEFIRKVYKTRAGRRVVRRAILSMGRKNGKTGLIGALVDAHLIGPEAQFNSNIYSAARSREQAALVFNFAYRSMASNAVLEPVYRVQYTKRMLTGLMRNVTYKALSAEAKTAHGLSPALSIHDELGQVVGPHDPLYEALETAGGAHHEPLSIVISTQAANDSDLLSVLIDDAARANDESFVAVVYELARDADIFDESNWRQANFALGKFRSIEEFREAARRAKRIPSFESTFRNLYLNQRVVALALYLSPTVWRENSAQPDEELFHTQPVHIGIDLSARTDLTAAVLATRDPKTGHPHIKPFVYTPRVGIEDRARIDRAPYPQWIKEGKMFAIGGRVIDYAEVVEHLAEQTKGMNISSIAFDRWRIDLLKTEAERQGFAPYAEWKPIGQGFKDMSPRLEYFEQQVLNGVLHHGGHPLLNLAASSAVAVFDPAKNRKLEKVKSSSRIDPLVAAVMAVGCLSEAVQGMTADSVLIM